MPAIMDDPTSARIPSPTDTIPITIKSRLITLRNGQNATILPFSSQAQVPPTILAHLSKVFNDEIEAGDTYPMLSGMSLEAFSAYWLQAFAAIMLAGDCSEASTYESRENLELAISGHEMDTLVMGTFYVKPNYPGRSSHICNAGFLVSPSHRGIGVGRLLGEAYLDYAPKLGYEYSVFNLVYETNVASTKIWDALGFQKIGRIPGAGNLKSFPGERIDAIVYGKRFDEQEVSGQEEPKGRPQVIGI